MAYLYIHIPQIFPTGVFKESKFTGTLISKKIQSKGRVVKRRLFPIGIHSLMISFVRTDPYDVHTSS